MEELATSANIQADLIRRSALRARAVEKAAYETYIKAHDLSVQTTADANWAVIIASAAHQAWKDDEEARTAWRKRPWAASAAAHSEEEGAPARKKQEEHGWVATHREEEGALKLEPQSGGKWL